MKCNIRSVEVVISDKSILFSQLNNNKFIYNVFFFFLVFCCSASALCHLSGYGHRPRSIEAISNGTIPSNGRSLNGCVTRGTGGLHEDSDFPPNPKTLSRRKPIVWMRPHVSVHINIKVYTIYTHIIKVCTYKVYMMFVYISIIA